MGEEVVVFSQARVESIVQTWDRGDDGYPAGEEEICAVEGSDV